MYNPEKVHNFTFKTLQSTFKIPLIADAFKNFYKLEDKRLGREVFGIKFPNPVGLAAGFDKDAKAIDELADLGFGFIEIGTITPKGQEGNPKPRLFRLVEDSAVINRMGFNNDGLQAAIKRLKNRKSSVIVGGNIGKNKVTPNELAFNDYKESYEGLFDYVDYFTVNVSSPNTPNLRELQEKEPLKKLLSGLKDLNSKKSKPKPILLKIAPDLTNEQLDDIVEIIQEVKLDGLIATNTTVSRDKLSTNWKTTEKIGAGGLSGKPLTNRSTEVIRYLSQKSNKSFPIVGVGGIMSAQDAIDKFDAGADLVQLYTGFIYEGPGLIKAINKALLKHN
jgi:dihydroorotate dehydrogenase